MYRSQTFKLSAKIAYIGKGGVKTAEYIVNNANECRDLDDLNAYQSAVQRQSAVVIGKITVELLQ